jgi:hypothetical protein
MENIPIGLVFAVLAQWKFLYYNDTCDPWHDCDYDKQNIYVAIFTYTYVTVNQFMVATSTLSLGTLGSVAFSLVATLYQEHDDRNHKQWNNLPHQLCSLPAILFLLMESGCVA